MNNYFMLESRNSPKEGSPSPNLRQDLFSDIKLPMPDMYPLLYV